MMYNNVMGRTQIYLGEEELGLLDAASRETGASRSELIRRAVRSTFGESDQATRLRALRESAGAWQDRKTTGKAQVEKLRRGDLDERLSKRGLR